jgi:hypothetical protein
VKAAHQVQDALDTLVEETAAQSADEFERAYRQFVVKVQCDLGETGKAPVGT